MKKALLISIVSLLTFVSCGKNDEGKDDSSRIKLETTELSVFSGEKAMLKITPEISGCTFTSENSWIASVSATGEVKGVTVGNVYVTVTNTAENFKAKCKVTVKPQYDMYDEPIFDFNLSQPDIISRELRKLLEKKDASLTYEGENKNIDLVMYLFEGVQYTSSGCAIPMGKLTMLTKFLSERYVPAGSKDDYIFMKSADDKLMLGISPASTKHVLVTYIPRQAKESNSEAVGRLNNMMAKNELELRKL